MLSLVVKSQKNDGYYFYNELFKS